MSKRDRDGNMRPKDSGKAAPAVAQSRFGPMFSQFRDELDEHHDRRERIIKASRDVTALSKKIIFSCQRVNKLGPLPQRTQEDIDSRMAEIKTHLTSIEADLASLNRYRYAYSLRCLEELVEALVFAHYLRTQTLLSPEAVEAAVPASIALTEYDYMYGVFDLFGEMMRFATVTAAQTGRLVGGDVGGDGAGQDEGGGRRRHILTDFHELSTAFELLPEIHDRTFRFKMEAMRTSVRKVEKLGYGIAIRGSERPKGWLPDFKDDHEPGGDE
ncbi:hypothetical protein ACRALDRAFT_1075741 [Sodiomyces alcalophilus JCM 7366]|uniref:uncharacterized protein n=1 Tax=Sodiomyces alcalophilus JCM 7366 TaxID=591952 RepID=UPI0039B5700D